MNVLDILIEINGTQIKVGEIRYHDISDAQFQYDPSYLAMENPRAISIGLPIKEESFSPQETRCFFEGLLPEGYHRKSVAQWMRVREEDYLSLLAGLGDECLGALRVIQPGSQSEEASYVPMSSDQMLELAREGSVKSAEILTRTHLSLAGASGKTGLYYDEAIGQWYFPYGEAPSTHIVKQCHLRLDEIVMNEQLCQLTAGILGINVPDSFIVRLGKNSRDALFATKRYDRFTDPASGEISGKIRPLRLHQEDFAMALGLSSSEKYETKDQNYLRDSFRILLQYSSDPIADQTSLWDLVIFDYLVGNTDNHLKNISLLYGKDLDSIRLAPAYDIISTAVYESSTRDMAMAVAGRYSLDEITRASFEEEAGRVGLGLKMAMDHFDALADNFEASLSDATNRMREEGLSGTQKIKEQILAKGGYHNL